MMKQAFFNLTDHWQQFQTNLLWVTHAPLCQRCRQPIDLSRQPVHHCHRCLDTVGYTLTPAFMTPNTARETTWAVREWTVRHHHQVVGYKRRPSTTLQPLLSDLLVRGWLDSQLASSSPLPPQAVAVVPMPRHDDTLPNHLTPLCRQMAGQLGFTLWPQGLERIRPLRAAQKTLNAHQRRINLAGSLATVERLPHGGIRQIVVLDDVRTTGASQAEAQRVLTAQFGSVCSIMGLTLLQMPAPDEADPHWGKLIHAT